MEPNIAPYNSLNSPELICGSSRLFNTLYKVYDSRYADFYLDNGSNDVEESFDTVLKVIGDPMDLINHQRYVTIGWAIALAAQPTIQYYFPDDSRPDTVVKHVSLWLANQIKLSGNVANTLFPEINKDGFGGHPAADEAYHIFYNLIKSLDPKGAYEAIVDILYDAMTGDAIIPSSRKKRQLFNWWLIDVVPSAYYLRLPSSFYCKTWPFVPLGSR
jgi:hypothetical protein